MDEMLRRLAEVLGVEALSSEEQQLLLECAREVAHGSERRHAPLSTFVLGVAVGRLEVDRETAVRESVERVRAVLADAADDDEPGRTQPAR